MKKPAENARSALLHITEPCHPQRVTHAAAAEAAEIDDELVRPADLKLIHGHTPGKLIVLPFLKDIKRIEPTTTIPMLPTAMPMTRTRSTFLYLSDHNYSV